MQRKVCIRCQQRRFVLPPTMFSLQQQTQQRYSKQLQLLSQQQKYQQNQPILKQQQRQQEKQNNTDNRLRQLALKRKNVQGDGNCLFYAASFLLKQNNVVDVDAQTLRQLACNFIEQNVEVFREDIEREYESVSRFQNLMRMQGTYGCYIVLCAISMLYNVNFSVHFPTNVSETNPGASRANLHIVFTRSVNRLNGHWEATERL